MRQLIDYLPQCLKVVEDIYDILQIQQIEIERLYGARSLLLSNMFIETADENGLAVYEKMLNIEGNEFLSLENRRFIVKTMMMDKNNITENYLKQQLNILCGSNEFVFDVDYNNYKVTIKLSIFQKEKLDAVKSLLSKVIPANMIMDVLVIFNTYGDVTSLTYQELSTMTNINIREEDI